MRTTLGRLLIATAVVLCCAASSRAQSCDDFNECTTPDLCVAGDCSGTPTSGGSCDDGNECTGDDTCSSGTCIGTPVNGACDDGNPCTTDDTCVDGTCHGTPASGTACGSGECGLCMNGQCLPDLTKQAMPCTDAIGACTENDVCLGTLCLGTFITCADSDNDHCTIDACNPATGQCQNFGPLNCGPCGACNPNSGQCENANDGASCDDLNSCTGNGTCSEGACAQGIPGQPTPTGTPTGTAAATATVTDTPTQGGESTPTITFTPLVAATDTPIDTPTGTPTGTVAATATDTPTEGTTTATPTGTDTPLIAPTETVTATPTGTAAATATETITATGTPTGTVSATVTSTPTNSGTVTATPPATATRTASATATPLPVNSTIIINSATGLAGSTVTFTVSLQTTVMVAGTQNDITFDPQARIAANDDGSPKCTVNPDITKPGTSFAFLPADCTGTECTAVRALVLALDNTNSIPNGSVLYSCEAAIAADATGSHPLTCSNPGAGDPDGKRLGVDCTSGTITVAPPGQASIVVGDANGAPGDFVPVEVSLQTAVQVSRTQNDIAFQPQAAVAAGSNGKPLCTVNPDIHKDGSTFDFLPLACTVGSTCTGVRAAIFSPTTEDPIPNGALLYTCQIAISATAANGTYPLTCSNPSAQTPSGTLLGATCVDGSVIVGVQPTTTSTATPMITQTPAPSSTATLPTATATLTAGSPTATVTQTPTVKVVPTPTVTTGRKDDDSCHIVPGSRAGTAWVLLLPAAVLLALRRRRR